MEESVERPEDEAPPPLRTAAALRAEAEAAEAQAAAARARIEASRAARRAEEQEMAMIDAADAAVVRVHRGWMDEKELACLEVDALTFETEARRLRAHAASAESRAGV